MATTARHSTTANSYHHTSQGKTLSIICSTLQWLRDHQQRQQKGESDPVLIAKDDAKQVQPPQLRRQRHHCSLLPQPSHQAAASEAGGADKASSVLDLDWFAEFETQQTRNVRAAAVSRHTRRVKRFQDRVKTIRRRQVQQLGVLHAGDHGVRTYGPPARKKKRQSKVPPVSSGHRVQLRSLMHHSSRH